MTQTARKFSVTLSQQVADALEAQAKKEGRSKANLACFALEVYARTVQPERFKPRMSCELPRELPRE